jgi:hypothetical protein
MADTSAFPTIHDVLVSGDNIQSFIAEGTIKAGMVVSFSATGVDNSVIAALQNTGWYVGVALYDAATGEAVAVACDGCVCVVCEGAGAAIDAGEYVMVDDCAIGGTVTVYDPAVIAHAATSSTPGATGHTLGIALVDIAANATGKVLLRMSPNNATIS